MRNHVVSPSEDDGLNSVRFTAATRGIHRTGQGGDLVVLIRLTICAGRPIDQLHGRNQTRPRQSASVFNVVEDQVEDIAIGCGCCCCCHGESFQNSQ